MSKIGKLLRGLKWHNFRNLEGTYHKDIRNDPHKMDEVNFYLYYVKNHDTKAISNVLEEYMIADLKNVKENIMIEIAKKLDDIPLIEKPKPAKEKSSKEK